MNEDGTALGFNAQGGVGCISVTANVAPKLCSQFQAALGFATVLVRGEATPGSLLWADVLAQGKVRAKQSCGEKVA